MPVQQDQELWVPGLLRGQMGDGGRWCVVESFGGGGAKDMEECDIAPLRSP